MTRLSVGVSYWAGLNQAQRQQLTESFGRYISAIYADRFDSYAGQKLQVTGEQPNPGGVMVKSEIVKANGEPVKVDYLMRRNGEGWLISDIYLDGAISEVATRRSEFAAILKNRRRRRPHRRPQPQGRHAHRDHGTVVLIFGDSRATAGQAVGEAYTLSLAASEVTSRAPSTGSLHHPQKSAACTVARGPRTSGAPSCRSAPVRLANRAAGAADAARRDYGDGPNPSVIIQSRKVKAVRRGRKRKAA